MITQSIDRIGLRAVLTPVFGVIAVLASGCGGNSTGSLHSVKGKVTLDGAPMTAGSVRFAPDKAKGNQAANEPVGTIGPDGTYTVSTAGKPGAPAGWYKVTVASGDIPDSSKPLVKSSLNPRYANPDFTDLAVEVVSSPTDGAYDLKLSSK